MTRTVRPLCPAGVITLATLLIAARAPAEDPPTLAWIRQFGAAGFATAGGDVSADSLGNIFVAGQSDSETVDRAFLRTYDFEGNFQRSYELPPVGADEISSAGVWADGLGNAYWVGGVGPTSSTKDPYVYKFDAAGTVLWDREIPRTGNAGFGEVSGDGLGNVYLVGSSSQGDGFLYKFDVDGNTIWAREFIVGYSGFADVAADALGNIYVSGSTHLSFGGPNAGEYDAILTKFDGEGNQVWARQFGGANYEFADGVETDGIGNVYVAGERWLASYKEAFVRKYDSDGNLLWNRQFGGAGSTADVQGIASDGYGNIYVSGYTEGSLGGANAGESDAFIRKYDAAGNVLWTYQLGSPGRDDSNRIWADGLGNILIAGTTFGDLVAPLTGTTSDAWVALLREYLAGDYNADDVIDATDYTVWKSSFGSTTSLAADGNRNGIIDAADYVVWRNNLALSNPTTRANASLVPEPASIGLLGAALAIGGSWARRR